MQNKEIQRTVYLDFLRILSTIAVIVIHVSASYIYTDLGSFEWHINNIYDSIVRWAVPVFIMISGALFLDVNRPLDIKKLYTKNIFRLVSAYIFWSVLYAWEYADRSLESMIIAILKGHYHMWYIPMMIGIYIMVPILKKVVESREITRYFLAIVLLFSFLCPDILDSMCQSKIAIISGIGQACYNVLNNTMFLLAIGYLFYFVCGHCLNSIELGEKCRRTIYAMGILGGGITIMFTALVSLRDQVMTEEFYGYFKINVMFEAIAIFVFVKYKLANMIITREGEKIVCQMSKYCFGIYLIHVLILGKLQNSGVNILFVNPVLGVPASVLIVFCISFLFSFLLYHIPVLKKIV